MVHVIWEFQPKPDKVKEFEKIYGSLGAWAQLFRKSSHYRETRLLRDTRSTGHYLVIDIWDDLEAYLNFKHKHHIEYDKLDHECERLTAMEKQVGIFEVS